MLYVPAWLISTLFDMILASVNIISPSSGSFAVTSFNGSNESPTVNTLSDTTTTGVLLADASTLIGKVNVVFLKLVLFSVFVNTAL